MLHGQYSQHTRVTIANILMGRVQTMHFKFLNAIASHVRALNLPKDHEHSAYRFHQDMFQSGIERIISVRPLPQLYAPSTAPGTHFATANRSRARRRPRTTRRSTLKSRGSSRQQACPVSTSPGRSPG